MTLLWRWSHPTTPAGVGWDIIISPGRVRLLTEKGISARAALGEAEVIRLMVDDPDGSQDFKTLHRMYAVEDATSGQQLVWNGYISDQYIDRGEMGDLIHPFGTGRRWELELTQENTLLGFRVVQGTETAADGVRPEETPGARLRWILASPFLSTVHDEGLIDWADLDAQADMNANDYRGQTAGDVLRDISLKTGLNHYARYRDASSNIELAFYNPNTSTLDPSTFRVSNVAADVDYITTWPPHHPVRLQRKGDRVAAGVLVQGNGVQSYAYDYATSYEFGFRDMVVSDNNTNTQAQADRLVARLLAQHDEQDERITELRIQVPAANLNDVRHGQRMEAKFQHLPGWTSFRWARVVSKSFSRPDNDTQALYDVDLELSPQSLLAVEQFITETDLGAYQSFTWDFVPGAGNLLIGFLAQRDTSPYNASVTPIDVYDVDFLNEVAGTEWTYIIGLPIWSVVYQGETRPSGITMVYRDSTSSDTQFAFWQGLNGSSRPRGHEVEVAGLSGAPTVTATSQDQHMVGAVCTSPEITVTVPGFIFAGMSYRCAGPADGASASFVMEPRDDAVTLTRGFAHGEFGPYSWFGYLQVAAAGTYQITLDRSAAPRHADWPYGWIMGFWPN